MNSKKQTEREVYTPPVVTDIEPVTVTMVIGDSNEKVEDPDSWGAG